MTEIETMLPPVPPPADPVTVSSAVLDARPGKPLMLAVMTVVPAATAVAIPEELIVATLGLLEDQAAELVAF